MLQQVFLAIIFLNIVNGLSFKTVKSITPFVVNGTDAKIEEFPYLVSLQWKFNETTWIHYCGGTILNEIWVLTAG